MKKLSAVLDTLLSNAAKDYPTDLMNLSWFYGGLEWLARIGIRPVVASIVVLL